MNDISAVLFDIRNALKYRRESCTNRAYIKFWGPMWPRGLPRTLVSGSGLEASGSKPDFTEDWP
ncbi:hypothetical protein AVEN_7077-1, partial [Araneus ventricosus]